MYICEFFQSLTLLQSSSCWLNEAFFEDKVYVEILPKEKLTSQICVQDNAQNYLIYKDSYHQLFYAVGIDDINEEIETLSTFQISIPSSQAIYLEASVIEAIYLYDHIFDDYQKRWPIDLLLPLMFLDNLFCQNVKDNQECFPKTYRIPCLHQLFIKRFYYFIIQYCYYRFQCQDAHSLTHPYHFENLVQNKLHQYIQHSPIQNISELTYLENKALDQFVRKMSQNGS